MRFAFKKCIINYSFALVNRVRERERERERGERKMETVVENNIIFILSFNVKILTLCNVGHIV